MEGGLKVQFKHEEQPAPSSYLQMREGSGGKFDVHCFLFTDMLLVCKSLSRKGERVKVSMIMVSMIIMIMIIMMMMTCARISFGRRRRSNSLFHFTYTFHLQSQVIRQPYIVDRLVVVEASRDSTQPSLACVYLNEVFHLLFLLHLSHLPFCSTASLLLLSRCTEKAKRARYQT